MCIGVCSEAGEQRSRLQTSAAVDSQTAAERYHAETTELRRQLSCARDGAAQLQQQLVGAGDRQAALVVELRRTAQQLSSGQMELEASRAIASVQRETILVREAEIARLEARFGLVERQSGGGGTTPGGSASGVDLTTVAVPPCPPPAAVDTGERLGAGSSAKPAITDEADGGVADNPDSLLAMWHQLQLDDAVSQSAGDSTAARDRRNPPGAASTRFGSALEEKARVQSRIKALIGYRELPKKTTAAKPRMSVRPQPMNHSRSITTSTSLKTQRRPSASDSVNTSQLSTAVSRYASSSADHLTTS